MPCALRCEHITSRDCLREVMADVCTRSFTYHFLFLLFYSVAQRCDKSKSLFSCYYFVRYRLDDHNDNVKCHCHRRIYGILPSGPLCLSFMSCSFSRMHTYDVASYASYIVMLMPTHGKEKNRNGKNRIRTVKFWLNVDEEIIGICKSTFRLNIYVLSVLRSLRPIIHYYWHTSTFYCMRTKEKKKTVCSLGVRVSALHLYIGNGRVECGTFTKTEQESTRRRRLTKSVMYERVVDNDKRQHNEQ